jgi:hypothetical protein
MQPMHVTRLGMVVLALAGCEKTDPLFCQENPGASGCPRPDGDVQQGDGGGIDMAGPTADARLCYGAGAYTVCLTQPPIDPIIFTGNGTLDTDTSTSCGTAMWTMANDQPDACFLLGTMVQIPNLTVRGSRPLVIVSASTIHIADALDIAGHRATGSAGAGANIGCATNGALPGGSDNGGGGGAGGSFLGLGGDGGDGNGTNNNGTPADGVVQAPTRLRGGCNGQTGGQGQGNGTGGAAGRGGGALVLIAGTQITLGSGAVINASGGGGGAPGREGGGGGGGSGGMIVLNAPAITAQGAAFIAANGGSGAAGEDDAGNTAAVPGNDPDPTMPTVPAPGAIGPGGNGGAGATETEPAQSGQNAGSNRGGGGGGGAKGYIQSNVAIANVTASPTITVIADP